MNEKIFAWLGGMSMTKIDSRKETMYAPFDCIIGRVWSTLCVIDHQTVFFMNNVECFVPSHIPKALASNLLAFSILKFED